MVGDERLAFAGLHLGDVALVEDDAAHQLDVEGRTPEVALERFAHGGNASKRISSRLSPSRSLAELDRLRGELLVRERLELRLERADVRRLLGQPLEPPAFADAQDFLEEPSCSTPLGYRGSAAHFLGGGLCSAERPPAKPAGSSSGVGDGLVPRGRPRLPAGPPAQSAYA